MTFPWVAYLEVAEALLQHRETFAHEEACCRTSISRAYYAIFCAARNYAQTREHLLLESSGTDHTRVQRHFQQGASPGHRMVGNVLMRLRRARNQADYEDTVPNVVRQAETAVQRARDAFAALDAIRS